jgi:hypothetical protein
MRTADYMGRESGARAVELRRGSVSYISLGSVERYSAERAGYGQRLAEVPAIVPPDRQASKSASKPAA